ncbi:uncharacterized protein [Cherax quadricarinatus]|uniref:uncharacterized protein isoform X3 n=1 Tax=Cherax quadricarinatus TaxID=27406 RepID=UPI00387EC944
MGAAERMGVRTWVVVVMVVVGVWVESCKGEHHRSHNTRHTPIRREKAKTTSDREFGEMTELGRMFLRCSKRRVVRTRSWGRGKKNCKRLSGSRTSPGVRTATGKNKSSQRRRLDSSRQNWRRKLKHRIRKRPKKRKIVGACGGTYVLGAGDEVKFKLPRSSTFCEMIFTPQLGSSLSFSCKIFRTARCSREFLHLTDGISTSITSCDRLPPRPMTALSQLYLLYERRRKKAKKSRIVCLINAQGSNDGVFADSGGDGGGGGGSSGGDGGGDGDGLDTAQGHQAPGCASMCGAAPSDAGVTRIVGGGEAQPGEYPWMLMLKINDGRSPKQCGGALITRKEALTAAHCLNFENLKVTVIAGQHDVNNDGTTQVVGVQKMTVHPDFDPMTLANDIAVITLEEEVTWNQRVGPVCLSPPRDYQGNTAVVSGWGTLTYLGSQPESLQEVAVQVTSHQECETSYKQSSITILDTHVCAAAPGMDACQGDSGGPLVMLTGGIWYQVS